MREFDAVDLFSIENESEITKDAYLELLRLLSE